MNEYFYGTLSKIWFGGLLAAGLSLLFTSAAHAQLIYTNVSADYSGAAQATYQPLPEVTLVSLSGVVSPQTFNDTPLPNTPYSNSAVINGTEFVSVNGLSPGPDGTPVQASATVSSTLYTYSSQSIAGNAATSIVLNSSAPEIVTGQTSAVLSFQFYVNQAVNYDLNSSWTAQGGTTDTGVLLFNTNNPNQIFYTDTTGGIVSLISATGNNGLSEVTLSPGTSYTLEAQAVGNTANASYNFSFTPAAVPEPSSWALMLSAMCLLALLRIRFRRTSS